ncbi:hypothetical protein [Nocardia jiangxiensis]|uniref:hypothetical protein n=1 Tax=Nocardia jiangxiensis TaxID=282685 RepID=UPI0002FFD796|nr:hypothetical protein [Nocardia jiangxiensis]
MARHRASLAAAATTEPEPQNPPDITEIAAMDLYRHRPHRGRCRRARGDGDAILGALTLRRLAPGIATDPLIGELYLGTAESAR